MPSPEFSINRVEARVSQGGHHVPDDVVRRRYEGGLRNFFTRYLPLTDTWTLYDNTEGDRRVVAYGKGLSVDGLEDELLWARLSKEFGHA
jgi:predicted ABC-type ATPase